MALSALTPRETDVVFRCLRASAEGPFFPEWEFHLLFGLERSQVAAVATCWPEVSDADEDVRCAINNSLNNLLTYPHNKPDAFKEWVGEPAEEVERIFKKWRRSCGLSA
jgi:hypothetical protein